jgi:ABC-type multidrug transport system ATPase subunit
MQPGAPGGRHPGAASRGVRGGRPPEHAVTATAPVLCAGVGVRSDGRWVLRMASFRLDQSDLGSAALGIATPRSAAATALIGLLSGRMAPDYGSLRVLGYDLRTIGGRAAVRRQSGIACRASSPLASTRVRALVDRAARKSGQPGSDRYLLVAAILDRLGLMPWADVPIGAAPELIVRKVRLAIACVHQPKLLLIDALLDHLQPLDRTVLADVIRDFTRDTAVIALGADADALALVCDRVIALTGTVLVGVPRVPVLAEDAGPVLAGDDPISFAHTRH